MGWGKAGPWRWCRRGPRIFRRLAIGAAAVWARVGGHVRVRAYVNLTRLGEVCIMENETEF